MSRWGVPSTWIDQVDGMLKTGLDQSELLANREAGKDNVKFGSMWLVCNNSVWFFIWYKIWDHLQSRQIERWFFLCKLILLYIFDVALKGNQGITGNYFCILFARYLNVIQYSRFDGNHHVMFCFAQKLRLIVVHAWISFVTLFVNVDGLFVYNFSWKLNFFQCYCYKTFRFF